MKTVATFPAFDVVDLEIDVINITAAHCDHFSGMRFCISKESMRHGNLYPEVSPNCIAYYCANDEGGAEVAIARSTERKEPLYWFNNCGSSITAHARPHYTMFLIKEGQKVRMADTLLSVRIVQGHIRLDVVEA
jgi:metal-dependent hydrolase (beta-lactamase superfamily II)